MSKGVNKHCSILNYIRHADNELYELVQDLCIGRIFVPRRGSPGITFLRPDKNLLKEIQQMASGDNPEEAVEAIQSLVLLDNLPSLRDFDDKKSDIPTFLRKKLPVVSADSKKVSLKNGAEIVPDKDFMSRSDRPNISVYHISKALVAADGETADFSNAKLKEKRGGGDLGDVNSYNKRFAFENVLNQTFENAKEPAMELLVALHGWASKNNQALAELIASQCSYDALASLAIVLQPYKQGGNVYINRDEWEAFLTAAYGMKSKGNVSYRQIRDVFSFNVNASDNFDALVSANHVVASSVSSSISSLSSRVGKPTIVTSLAKFYGAAPKTCAKRDSNSAKEHFAEAELRVISAILSENEAGKDEVAAWFAKLTLDTPYMCDDKSAVSSGNIGFYFSTVYLIARSDALFYVPGIVCGGKLSDIANEDVSISICNTLKDARSSKRAASQETIVATVDAIKAAQF